MAKVIKTVEDLNQEIKSCTENLDKKFSGKNGKRSITICGGTGCLSSNSGEILQKFEQLINLIASVEIISKSEKFIGTYNANPGMFLGMKMPTSKIYGMDRKHWDYRGGWFFIKAFIKKCLGIKLQMK